MVGMCLLLPACISMKIQIRRNGNKMLTDSILGELLRYGSWVLGINFLTMMVITYFLGIEGVREDAFGSFPFAVKYVVISVLISVVVPYILEIFKKYISVTFIVGENDEKNK